MNENLITSTDNNYLPRTQIVEET